MREIKFRAWEKKPHTSNPDYKQEMQYDVQHCTFCDGGECFDRFLSDDWVLMQFTGLLDRNGKEIYEGDLIDCFDTSGEKVYYTPQEVKLPEWYKLIWDETNTEVVGNIYENPELLTKK